MQTSWRRGSEIAGVCDNQIQTARKSLILKRPVVSERSESNGEMSEWLKEHAWKAKRASDTEPLQRASTHTRSAT